MKKQIIFFLLAAFLFFTNSSYAQWTSLGQAGFNATDAPFISMAVDTDNIPYIAFEDADNASGKLTVMKFINSQWTVIGSRGISAEGINYTSIAIGPDNMPYVAYQDNGTAGNGTLKASVIKYTGTSWVNVGSVNFSAGAATDLVLQFDHIGTLYIAYADAISGAVTIQKFGGTAWAPVGTQPTIPISPSSSAISLAIDTSNVPYVAFSDSNNSGKISVLKYNGSSWAYLGIAGFTAPYSDWPVLMFPGGSPMVVYSDAADSMKVSAMKLSGTTWSYSGAAGFSAGTGAYGVSMALDPLGTPYIAYADNDGDLSVFKFNGTSWGAVGMTGFTPDPASFITMSIDRLGNIYVAYDPSSSPTDAPVVKYASALGVANVIAANQINVYPNPVSGILHLNYQAERVSFLTATLYNTAGQQAGSWQLNVKEGTNDHALPVGLLAAGVYLLQIHTFDGEPLSNIKVAIAGNK